MTTAPTMDRVVRIDGERADEGAIDLEGLDREAAEMGQRRVAGAEVIDRADEAEVARIRNTTGAALRGPASSPR